MATANANATPAATGSLPHTNDPPPAPQSFTNNGRPYAAVCDQKQFGKVQTSIPSYVPGVGRTLAIAFRNHRKFDPLKMNGVEYPANMAAPTRSISLLCSSTTLTSTTMTTMTTTRARESHRLQL
ncbi:hypothetical protein BGZ83_010727 [Gryganskiella cystojenkinii]|nr:hypothetical protein BGZ83_010727 [Gryganskiella cystojenkinii]